MFQNRNLNQTSIYASNFFENYVVYQNTFVIRKQNFCIFTNLLLNKFVSKLPVKHGENHHNFQFLLNNLKKTSTTKNRHNLLL